MPITSKLFLSIRKFRRANFDLTSGTKMDKLFSFNKLSAMLFKESL